MDKNTTSTELTYIKTTIFKQEKFQCCCCCWPSWCCCLGWCCWPKWCCWPSRCCKQQVTYRIPALLYISDTKTYLAFAEKRNTPDDTDAEVLVMRRGKWSEVENKVEWDSGHEEFTSASLSNHRSMNPCPVYERKSKTLFLFFICVPDRVSERDQKKKNTNQARLCYVKSKDAGTTWSQTIDLTADVIGEKEKNWATFAVGPGHGVQMESDRLIIPAYASRYTGNPDCTSCCCLSLCCFTPYALAFYSDDQGITWKVGNQMHVESCECQMAEITDEEGKSTLYCNARTELGYRAEARSNNSGVDFGTVLSTDKLIETGNGCQGSVLSFREKSNATKKWLLYSHPSNAKSRVDLGIYLNKTPLKPSGWPDEPLLILHQGPSAYSDLVEYEPRRFACLMECGTEHENEEIAFLLFELPEKKL